MNFYLSFPMVFIKFWFLEAPLGIIGFFSSVNTAFFQLFSLPLLLRTFFKPIKNEYRKGLVGFSIGMGIVIKSIIILADLLIFILLLLLELLIVISFVLLPFAAVVLLFI